jgi:C4-type Zn-finger protein
MPRYIRRCPKCQDCLALVVNDPPQHGPVLTVYGYCLVCGYRLRGWRLILGRKQNARRELTLASK